MLVRHALFAIVFSFGGMAAMTAKAADVPLTEAEVRSQLVGKDLDHDGLMHITFAPDGNYSSGNGRFGSMGTYRLEKDGRLCWRDRVMAGCFQYYRRDGKLRVRRNDAENKGDIGPVLVGGPVR